MDARRFDTLSRSLAHRLSRRTAIGRFAAAGSAASVATIAGLARPAADARQSDATPAPGTPTAAPGVESAEFLFVQTGTSGSFKPKSGSSGVYTLTLTGHTGETVYFSDQPERIVGNTPTDKFFKSGFAKGTAPNAALVADTPQQQGDILLVALTNPSYDASAKSVSYDATILHNYAGQGLRHLAALQQDDQIAEEFGAASLFIDGICGTATNIQCCIGLNCYGSIGDDRECWQWSTATCVTCTHCDVLAQECNSKFSQCNNQCVDGNWACW